MSKVRTRFAPSPTGTPESIHLGFVIRALWNYAYAKKNGGEFILRIEDTDQKRSRKDTEKAIFRVLKKFGINWDEGPDVGGPHAPYRQSERLDKYQEAAHKLVEKGFAYYDFDAQVRGKEEIKAAYESEDKLQELKVRPKARSNNLSDSLDRIKKGEKFVVRVKIPEDRVFEYEDWILKKKIKFLGKEIPDLILLKSDGFPTYHLAVVVDDIDMKISHVFRGQEWISSTPIHLFVYEGLGHKVPEIGHFSVILDPRTGKKFSKRDMTAMFGVESWLKKNYLPEALLNYLMLLGWAPKDNNEIFTLEEFVQAFDRDGIQKANPTFDEKKLDWFNSQYYQKEYPLENTKGYLNDKNFVGKNVSLDKIKGNYPVVYNFVTSVGSTSIYRDNPKFNMVAPGTAAFMPSRMNNIYDYDQMTDFFYKSPDVDMTLLTENYKNHLLSAVEVINDLSNWGLDDLNEKLIQAVKSKGYKTGDFFMDLRIAIAGKKFTPPINDSIIILGKEDALKRLSSVLGNK